MPEKEIHSGKVKKESSGIDDADDEPTSGGRFSQQIIWQEINFRNRISESDFYTRWVLSQRSATKGGKRGERYRRGGGAEGRRTRRFTRRLP
ncbi:hypothetical protein EVAR_61845_1 [Eumeta japonica]|uniref:Uncharacterized protein n=1 Tax=Eumeta variegata TaxID=151549 RepID=A0A4C1ZVJ6_EUMVA|nr:hypothetical protein EVAR_61845_1 [Eumeta japonica]